jgi:phosphate starvation-inducible PhoH-like protein
MMNGPTDRDETTVEQRGGQPAGSQVLMTDGTWKAIQQVAVGDLVLSPQPDDTVLVATVAATSQQTNHPVYRVETMGKSLRSYRCSGDQILPVLVWQTHRQQGRRPGRRELRELSVQALLTRGSVFQRRAQIFSTPAIELPDADLPVHPYVVGVLLGNGCLLPRGTRHRVEVAMRRRITFTRMRRCGAQLGQMRYRHGAYQASVVGAYKALMTQQPHYGEGSHTKFVPEVYKRASLEQRRWLLAGLIDSDGNAHMFSSTSRQWVEDFVDLIHSIGGWASLRVLITPYKDKTCTMHLVCYATAVVSIPAQIGYKRRSPRHARARHPCRHTFRLKPDGLADVYGFTLASPSSWYITDNWLVTCAADNHTQGT